MTTRMTRWEEAKELIKLGLKTLAITGTLSIATAAYANHQGDLEWKKKMNPPEAAPTNTDWSQTFNRYDIIPIDSTSQEHFTATLRNILELNSNEEYTLFNNIMGIRDGELRGQVLATIAAESVGKPHATSKSGVLGLMQVTYATAVAHGGVEIENYYEMRNPELSLEAGINIWKYNSQFFENYTDHVELSGAAYNAGPRVIERLVEKAAEKLNNPNPTYEETMKFLTPNFLAAMDPDGYGTWTPAKLRNKVQEIRNHGYKTAQYYAVARERGLHEPEMTYTDPTFVGPVHE